MSELNKIQKPLGILHPKIDKYFSSVIKSNKYFRDNIGGKVLFKITHLCYETISSTSDSEFK